MPDTCLGVLKEQPRLQVPGFALSEMASSICRAVEYDQRGTEGELPSAIELVRTSRWPHLAKAVSGGMQHVVSVDNAAYYAELWAKGGSWYAVTGARLPDDPGIDKALDEKSFTVNEMRGVYKGMPAPAATSRFLSAVFGPQSGGTAKPCGCK